MAHLSPDMFIDLLDGTVDEAGVPHLAQCAACRKQLDDARSAWVAAQDVVVPEPSPLFWDHLSRRVSTAVAVEPIGGSRRWNWRFALISTAATAAVVVAVVLRLPPQRATPAAPVVSSPSASTLESGAIALEPLPDDPSLTFVADLASNIEWDSADAFGLPTGGDADRVVAEMNDDERAELRRLLNEELGSRPGSL
jgi:hypothetical protein